MLHLFLEFVVVLWLFYAMPFENVTLHGHQSQDSQTMKYERILLCGCNCENVLRIYQFFRSLRVFGHLQCHVLLVSFINRGLFRLFFERLIRMIHRM